MRRLDQFTSNSRPWQIIHIIDMDQQSDIFDWYLIPLDSTYPVQNPKNLFLPSIDDESRPVPVSRSSAHLWQPQLDIASVAHEEFPVLIEEEPHPAPVTSSSTLWKPQQDIEPATNGPFYVTESVSATLKDGTDWLVDSVLEANGMQTLTWTWNPFPIRNETELAILETIISNDKEKWQQLVSFYLMDLN